MPVENAIQQKTRFVGDMKALRRRLLGITRLMKVANAKIESAIQTRTHDLTGEDATFDDDADEIICELQMLDVDAVLALALNNRDEITLILESSTAALKYLREEIGGQRGSEICRVYEQQVDFNSTIVKIMDN